ncbi:MAG: cupin domain-containing protein [Kangiellaceae bacterium]
MLNIEKFLKTHWQKSACYIPKGYKGSLDFLTADQLAGLALENDIESRIISGSVESQNWDLLHGPFERSNFNNLNESEWTLLIQSIDSWEPITKELAKAFNFIPNWRFDDLMVSYAADNGGVGPHVDNYDVFLVQAEGSRRWRVGKMGDIPKKVETECNLPQVSLFEPVIDIVMHPGDILYIPPNTAHWGVSIGESMGYSVGYRSPQVDLLLVSLAEAISHDYRLNPFFTDPYRHESNESAQIEDELISWAQTQLQTLAENPRLIQSILAKQLSLSKLGIVQLSNNVSVDELDAESIVTLNPELKANWYKRESHLTLCIEGESWKFDHKSQLAIQKLASYERIPIKLFNFSSDLVDFPDSFTNLINTGYINLHKS